MPGDHAARKGGVGLCSGAALIAVAIGTVALLGDVPIGIALLAFPVAGAVSLVGCCALRAISSGEACRGVERRVGPDGIVREVPREWLQHGISRPIVYGQARHSTGTGAGRGSEASEPEAGRLARFFPRKT